MQARRSPFGPTPLSQGDARRFTSSPRRSAQREGILLQYEAASI